MSDTQHAGLIVASFGRQAVVEDEQRERFNCRMKGRKLRPVCGDRVRWQTLDDDDVDGVIISIDERDTLLKRPTRRGRDENVAANLTQMVVVFATEPPADPFLVDRYIASAEHLRIRCVLVYNKQDLREATLPDWLVELRELGYPVVSSSAKEQIGLDQLRELCDQHINILVGQSGVGKSSLLNALIPGVGQATQNISDSGKFGRHTTSASYLYHLPESAGALIDSPGVRDFAPPPLEEEQVPSGFIDVFAAAENCRFSNCRHENEPKCAVKQAVDDGTMSERRYTSYLQLLSLMRELKTNAGHAMYHAD